MPLTDKRVVIIGGSSGMGLASARAAAAAGAYVLIAGRSKEKLHRAMEEIGGEVEGHTLDVTREDEVRDFFAGVGALDHLVDHRRQRCHRSVSRDGERSGARGVREQILGTVFRRPLRSATHPAGRFHHHVRRRGE